MSHHAAQALRKDVLAQQQESLAEWCYTEGRGVKRALLLLSLHPALLMDTHLRSPEQLSHVAGD